MKSTHATARSQTPQLADRARWRMLIVLFITIFMSLINVSMVNVALPTIRIGLDASASDLQWILSGYALTFGVVLVAAGRAGDVVGRGGIFIIGTIIFTLASIACGLAPTADYLNVARFIQGVGAGLLNPQGIGMVQQHFRGEARGRAFGYFGSMVGVSVAIGPVLGGLLIKIGGLDLGWRLTFLINAPLGALIVVLAFLWFPKPLLHAPTRTLNTRTGKPVNTVLSFDPVGAVLLGLGVFFILYPFVEYKSSRDLQLLLGLGIAFTVIWAFWEGFYARAVGTPMVNLNIFRTPSFRNGSIVMALYFMGMTSIWVIVALFLQEGLDKSALQAGAVSIPASVISAFAANWAGKRVMQLGRRVVIGGLWLAIAGLVASIAVVYLNHHGHASIWWLLLTLTLIGIAQGAVISPNQTLTLMEVPVTYAGSSGAVMQTGQRIGTSVGIALITSALFISIDHYSWPTAVAISFTLIILIMLISLAFAWLDLRQRHQQSQAADA